MFELAKEIYFDKRALVEESTRDKSPIRLLKSPAIMTSGTSTLYSPENSDDLYDRKKLLIEEKQAGNNSNIIDEEIIGIGEKLLEYKCRSTKQLRFLFIKCLN